jgi:hypothetical protein
MSDIGYRQTNALNKWVELCGCSLIRRDADRGLVVGLGGALNDINKKHLYG